MGKVLKVVAGLGLLALGVFTGGVVLFGALTIGSGTLLAAGAALLLSTAASALAPKVPESQLSRLNISLDPSTPRKAVFGTTAMNLDLRYHEGTGQDQEEIEYIIACAAHEVASIDEIWFEQEKAWDSSSGVTSKYSGYLTVTTRLVGTSGNGIAISSTWSSTATLTGCAYVYIKIKRRGNSDDEDSPLVNGLPQRVTIRGEGALLYDPRLDSTNTSGSGAHRADDQTTWGSYTAADDVDNPALQLLWWLLGWKINGRLSVGCGVPPERIDMESFITAANVCDEDVPLSGGGTQKRYRTSGTASDSDDRMQVVNTFLACMNGTLRDNGGKLSLAILQDDLADYVLDFDEGDVLDGFKWDQTGSLSQTYNVVRGRFVDPSDNSLYQLVDYPEVSGTSIDGIERILSLDLPFVEEGRRAQRIAKQVLQRALVRGQFQATFSVKALGCDVGEIIRLSFAPLGWTNKLFRVVSKEINLEGKVPLLLIEEDASIYAWSAEEAATITAAAPQVYDPLNSPFLLFGRSTTALITRVQTIAGRAARIYMGDDEPLPVYLSSGDTDDSPSLVLDFSETFQNGDLWLNESTGEIRRYNDATGVWNPSVADLTLDNQINFNEAAPFNIQADSSGDTTTDLTLVESCIKVYRGDTQITSGITTGTVTSTAGITASASVSAGEVTVTLSVASSSGVVTVPVIYNSVTYLRQVVVNRTQAAPNSGGSSGSSSFTDTNLTNVTGTTYITVSDADVQVESDGSGQLRFSINAGYNGTGTMTCQFEYSTDNSTWSQAGSDVVGDPSTSAEPGFISGSTTQTGLTANTNYYVRLRAKASGSAVTLSWSAPNFTVKQP